jgi:hypothetical protein
VTDAASEVPLRTVTVSARIPTGERCEGCEYETLVRITRADADLKACRAPSILIPLADRIKPTHGKRLSACLRLDVERVKL